MTSDRYCPLCGVVLPRSRRRLFRPRRCVDPHLCATNFIAAYDAGMVRTPPPPHPWPLVPPLRAGLPGQRVPKL